MPRLRHELLLLFVPVTLLLALPVVTKPLKSVLRAWSGVDWQIKGFQKHQPTPLERFDGTDCVVDIEASAPRRFQQSSVHLQRRFEVVASDGTQSRSLWLWDGSHELPTKITRRRKWSESVTDGNWHLCFSLASIPSSWGDIRLLCDLEARNGRGSKTRWKNSLVLRADGAKINQLPIDRKTPFKAVRMHLIERKLPFFAVELQYTPPNTSDEKPGDALWEELRWHRTHLRHPRLDMNYAQWFVTDQNDDELETGMHEVSHLRYDDNFNPISNRYEAQVQLRETPSSQGDLWLYGRLSVNDSWPQDLKVHLRNSKGHWLENGQSQISLKPATK